MREGILPAITHLRPDKLLRKGVFRRDDKFRFITHRLCHNVAVSAQRAVLAIDPSTAFVSYNREDWEFVLRVAKDLKAKGAKVWMDKLDLLALFFLASLLKGEA